jgi:hypothetical protein
MKWNVEFVEYKPIWRLIFVTRPVQLSGWGRFYLKAALCSNYARISTEHSNCDTMTRNSTHHDIILQLTPSIRESHETTLFCSIILHHSHSLDKLHSFGEGKATQLSCLLGDLFGSVLPPLLSQCSQFLSGCHLQRLP